MATGLGADRVGGEREPAGLFASGQDLLLQVAKHSATAHFLDSIGTGNQSPFPLFYSGQFESWLINRYYL